MEPLHPDHAGELFQGLQAPQLYTYMPGEPPVDPAAWQARVQRLVAGAPAESGETWLNWVLREAPGGAALGHLQLTLDAAGLVWLGYTVWPAVWGQGWGRAGVRWLVDEAARRWPQAELRAQVDARHGASLRALLGAGFGLRHTASATLHGDVTVDWVLGWAARQPASGPVAAVLVPVGDVAAALDWYGRALPGAGRHLVPGVGFECLRLDGVQIEPVPADERLPSGAAGPVAYWWVDDLAAALSRVTALGGVLCRGPMAIEAGLGMAQLSDPWGNRLGLRGPWSPPAT